MNIPEEHKLCKDIRAKNHSNIEFEQARNYFRRLKDNDRF